MDRHPDYPWDYHSDQPHVLRDRKFKRRLYLRGAADSLKTLAFMLHLPRALPAYLATPRTKTGNKAASIGLCVNLPKKLEDTLDVTLDDLAAMVAELGVRDILLRIPLADIENLAAYRELAKSLGRCRLVFHVLQDRRHIEDKELLEHNLRRIFDTFSTLGHDFVIGNAVNRRKWAFVTMREYFDFFEVAQKLRDSEFPGLQLAGGSVIDFELPNFTRSVLHSRAAKYDATAALLYVDRRGAPENRQFGFDLLAKLRWFSAIVGMSNKSGGKLWITEVNWPLKGTEPFAPATGECMVSEDEQASYLVRYYLQVLASGHVEKCFWHQLLAPGYGLVDNRGEALRKRRAYQAFRTLYTLFSDAQIDGYVEHDNGACALTASCRHGKIMALWSNNRLASVKADGYSYKMDVEGKACVSLDCVEVPARSEPCYLLQKPLETKGNPNG